MKKLNHIWVFSDGVAGHEIQSIALAHKIAVITTVFHCGIRQPWLSFAPRLLPRFGKNIIWKSHKPDPSQQPIAMITCGRRMAAVGKYHKRKWNIKHIQILNPGDNPNKYDTLICPVHDNLKGKNIISTQGSIHNITLSSLLPIRLQNQNKLFNNNKPIASILIGNPAKGFFNEISKIALIINQHFSNYNIFVCTSRRTPQKYHKTIKTLFSHNSKLWFDKKDGENPYRILLACSEVFIVTSDSINMVSEACATDKTVIAIAQDHISPKHKKFIESIQPRLSQFNDSIKSHTPLNNLDDVAQKTLRLVCSK